MVLGAETLPYLEIKSPHCLYWALLYVGMYFPVSESMCVRPFVIFKGCSSMAHQVCPQLLVFQTPPHEVGEEEVCVS